MPAVPRPLLVASLAFAASSLAWADGAQPLFDGLWCGTGLLYEFSLVLKQGEGSHAEGTLTRKGRVRHILGEISGNRVRTQDTKVGSLVLEVKGDRLRIVDGTGALMLTRGGSFVRSLGSSCG
jgi:hypothetical protein